MNCVSKCSHKFFKILVHVPCIFKIQQYYLILEGKSHYTSFFQSLSKVMEILSCNSIKISLESLMLQLIELLFQIVKN